MSRSLALLPAWWFIQIPNADLWKEGIGLGMVILIVWLWDRDRKGRISSQEQSDQRYETIVKQLFEQQKELKSAITGYTTAMTTLADRLAGNITNCPMSSDPVMGAWMRAWLEHSAEEAAKKNRTVED